MSETIAANRPTTREVPPMSDSPADWTTVALAQVESLLRAVGRAPHVIHPGWLALTTRDGGCALIGWAADTADPTPTARPALEVGDTVAGRVYRSAAAYAAGLEEGAEVPPCRWEANEAPDVFIGRLLGALDTVAAALPQQCAEVYVPVSVDLGAGSMTVDHAGAPWPFVDETDAVWTGEEWVSDRPSEDAAAEIVRRASVALAGLREIHARFGLDTDDDDVSGADICDALFTLMGRIGLEVQ